MHTRRYPEAEYQKCEGQPLSAPELAALWRGLPEAKRLSFFHSLREDLADQILTLCTAPAQTGAERKQDV
jgi:hypothetical protein